ncbi:MAG: hypothetical protein ACI841_002622 [Planctomycetota bacterium]|jgi:hypothetical protein
MKLHTVHALVALALSSSAFAQNTTLVEGFEGGSNIGNWSWGTGNESFSPLNGHPGAFLQDLTLFSCCPTLSTGFGATSVYTGNYRAEGVVSVGADLIILDASLSVGSRPLSVILDNDNGTPFNFDDDFGAYFIGDKDIPDAGVPGITSPGWATFDFVIPAAAASLPPGWQTFTASGFGASDAVWNAVIEDVDALQFFYGDPASIFLIISWDVGLDNVRITRSDDAAPGTPFGFGLDCPCGNNDPDSGCTNASGAGAHLTATGSQSVGADDLVMQATQLPPNAFGITFMGTTRLTALDFGNGLRVAGGNTLRYPVKNSGAGGVLTYGPGLAAFASGNFALDGQLVAGSTWNFQTWFRDVGGPCGLGFNLSNGVAVTFGL